MTDSTFFLSLEDVRGEVARLSTVHTNECVVYGVPHVEVIHGGTHATWKGGAYLECQEATLADGLYGIRIRWSRPGSQGERCWRISPWCAPADRLVFPGERVPGEKRETVGQLTLEEASTVPCSKHPGSMLADCGCKPLAEVLGEDLPWGCPLGLAEVADEVLEARRTPMSEAERAELAESVAQSAFPEQAAAEGFIDASLQIDIGPPGRVLVGTLPPVPFKPPTRPVVIRELNPDGPEQAAAVAATSQPEPVTARALASEGEGSSKASTVGADSPQAPAQGEAGPVAGPWRVSCFECQTKWSSALGRHVPPDSTCPKCGSEVELEGWPELEPNARAIETIGQLEQVVRKARKAKSLAACQVCHQPIEPGTHYMSPPGNSPRRRIHTLCVEAMARAEGPV